MLASANESALAACWTKDWRVTVGPTSDDRSYVGPAGMRLNRSGALENRVVVRTLARFRVASSAGTPYGNAVGGLAKVVSVDPFKDRGGAAVLQQQPRSPETSEGRSCA